MKLLEDAYEEIILTEKLAKRNITSASINKALSKEYAAYNERVKKLNPNKEVIRSVEKDDERVIKEVLATLLALDTRYTAIFNNPDIVNDSNRLKKALDLTHLSWKNSIQSSGAASYFFNKQPVNLALLDLLQEMGLKYVITKTNEQGWPVYPIHFLDKFIAMNVIDDLVKRRVLSQKQKNIIDKYLFISGGANIELSKEIEEYLKQTNAHPESEPEQIQPVATVQPTEEQIPEVPTKEDRLAMIKRLSQKS